MDGGGERFLSDVQQFEPVEWQLRMPEIATIDRYSTASVPIQMLFDDQHLADGTGFWWEVDDRPYLITNWHNVSGINPITGKHLSDRAGEPNQVRIWMDDPKQLGRRVDCIVPILSADGSAGWLEHPQHGRSVDVVALPVIAPTDLRTDPINKLPNDPMMIGIGMDAFVLGFPFGAAVGSLPIWKRASIASEPEVPVKGLPYFYVDTASRPGMSGSPVILRSWGTYIDDQRRNFTGPGAASRLVGVYSGRIGAEDELRAQLGIVWRASVVSEIVAGGRKGTKP